MRHYDSRAAAGIWWTPYVMFHCCFPNLEGPVLNTDRFGVRYTIDRNGDRVSPATLAGESMASALVGGSTAFGVGASSDATTIPSLISRSSGAPWINLGMRSWVLPQNLIQFLFLRPKLGRLSEIVLLAGFNELDIHMISNLTTRPYGPFYGWREFFSQMNRPYRDETRKEYVFPASLDEMVVQLGAGMADKDTFLEWLDGCLWNWASLAAAQDTRVLFCLQPISSWLSRKMAAAEGEIMAERFELHPHEPALFEAEAGAYRDWYRAALSELCGRHGIGFLDMNARFDGAGLDGEFLFLDPWHLTDRASTLVAEAIMEELEAEWSPG